MKKENLNNKIDDLKAHLEVIHSSIREQNKIVEELNKQRENLSNEITKANLDLSKIRQEKEDSLNIIEIHRKEIANDIKTFEENKSSFEKTVKLILADIETQKNRIDQDELTSKQRLFALIYEIKDKENHLNVLTTEYTKLCLSLTNKKEVELILDKNIQELNKESNHLRRELEIKTAEYHKISNEQKIILNKIQSDIEIEKNKIHSPLESLRKKEEEINTKEKQLQILLNRAKKVWEILYPGQSINI